MNKNILSLEEVTLKDVSLCGGKAANLGELTKLGLNVPKGFVITTNAYRDRDSNEIEREILTAFKKLNAKYVAVRSSATAEDASNMSWAGQLTTYLFTDERMLIKNIKKCWNSLNSPRASAYREQNNIKTSDVSVAVIIQEMIDADVSGVVFTRHPIIKDQDIMLIEAIYGLGEAIVSGMVTPDSYEISKKDCSIRDLSISKQAVKVSQARTGTKISDVFEEDQSKQKLSLTRIKELVRVCKEIEKHYSSPQDIEWCYKDNNLFILQSRPITTL